jgi:hypothetical protein
MNFTPKSKEELAMDGLLPAGKYPFSVIKAEEKTSKASGNPMLALQLTVYTPNGGQVTVFDYLMENKPAQLEQFCRFTGLEALYASGKLEESDCVGREGWVCIKTQAGKDGYDPRNVVNYYCPKPEGTVAGAPATRIAVNAAALASDDEIPF